MARATTKNLTTSTFKGSVPRRADHLVDFSSAARAVDCKLWHGTVEAWREPRLLRTVAEGTKSVYKAFNCCWLESSTCASYAEGAVELKHVYATNYNGIGYPVRIVTDDDCNPVVTRLGLPCPSLDFTLVYAQNVAKTKATAPRQYMIQYEDSYGNRSAGSGPSELIYVADDAPVVVSGWSLPTGGWDIAHVIILRTAPGQDNSFAEAPNKTDAAWMEVDRIPAGTASYTDTKHTAELYAALVEDDVRAPPAGMQGITWVTAMNCLAGFKGNRIYFSRNNSYNDWSDDLILDDTIRAIAEVNSTIYVATDGAPYVIEGKADCQTAACRRVVRFPEALPLVNKARGITAIPGGVAYATHNGVVVINGANAPILYTAPLYAPDDWQALHPDTARIEYFEGQLFCFFRKGGFVVGLKAGAGYTEDEGMHTELSLRPDETLVTSKGEFILRFGTALKEWNRGANKMPYEYVSGEMLVGAPVQMGAAQIVMAPGVLQFKVKMDGHDVLDEAPSTTKAYTLPMWAYGQSYRFELRGTATVKVVTVAQSMKEL